MPSAATAAAARGREGLQPARQPIICFAARAACSRPRPPLAPRRAPGGPPRAPRPGGAPPGAQTPPAPGEGPAVPTAALGPRLRPRGPAPAPQPPFDHPPGGGATGPRPRPRRPPRAPLVREGPPPCTPPFFPQAAGPAAPRPAEPPRPFCLLLSRCEQYIGASPGTAAVTAVTAGTKPGCQQSSPSEPLAFRLSPIAPQGKQPRPHCAHTTHAWGLASPRPTLHRAPARAEADDERRQPNPASCRTPADGARAPRRSAASFVLPCRRRRPARAQAHTLLVRTRTPYPGL